MRSSLWLGVQGPGIPHGGIDRSANKPAGRVSLLYNASNGYDCVVTTHINGYVGFGSLAWPAFSSRAAAGSATRMNAALTSVLSMSRPPISV
jgi:hypothetical protein